MASKCWAFLLQCRVIWRWWSRIDLFSTTIIGAWKKTIGLVFIFSVFFCVLGVYQGWWHESLTWCRLLVICQARSVEWQKEAFVAPTLPSKAFDLIVAWRLLWRIKWLIQPKKGWSCQCQLEYLWQFCSLLVCHVTQWVGKLTLVEMKFFTSPRGHTLESPSGSPNLTLGIIDTEATKVVCDCLYENRESHSAEADDFDDFCLS